MTLRRSGPGPAHPLQDLHVVHQIASRASASVPTSIAGLVPSPVPPSTTISHPDHPLQYLHLLLHMHPPKYLHPPTTSTHTFRTCILHPAQYSHPKKHHAPPPEPLPSLVPLWPNGRQYGGKVWGGRGAALGRKPEGGGGLEVRTKKKEAGLFEVA